jgi:hypothetical protein
MISEEPNASRIKQIRCRSSRHRTVRSGRLGHSPIFLVALWPVPKRSPPNVSTAVFGALSYALVTVQYS